MTTCGRCDGKGLVSGEADGSRAVRCPVCRPSEGRPYLGCWELPPESCEGCGQNTDEVWIHGSTGRGLCRSCVGCERDLSNGEVR